jgi:hypothetical protein
VSSGRKNRDQLGRVGRPAGSHFHQAEIDNGRWDGTWRTNPRELSDVIVQIEATLPQLNLRGTTQVRGGLRSLQRAPNVPDDGVVSAAASIAHQPLAPGSLISLYGLDLSEGQGAAGELPLPEVLQSTTLYIRRPPPAAAVHQRRAGECPGTL